MPMISRNSRISGARGFTMLELLVVIAIVGILATMSQMRWGRIYRSFAGRGAATDLRNALVLARADATTRGRYSGVAIDPAQRRYLRFIDSTAPGVHDGQYAPGEVQLQGWTELPRNVVFHSTSSSMSVAATTRGCGSAADAAGTIDHSGIYSVVFTPEGSSMTTFLLKMAPDSASRDTATISVLPATGLVRLDT